MGAWWVKGAARAGHHHGCGAKGPSPSPPVKAPPGGHTAQWRIRAKLMHARRRLMHVWARLMRICIKLMRLCLSV